MITRTTKYTASDGTEHDSPQAAATQDLFQALLLVTGANGVDDEDLIHQLARNPEALRDALDTYFEDLEAHPDVEDYSDVNPAILRKMMEDGVVSEATDEEIHRGTSCDKPLSPLSALEGITLTAPQEPPPPDVDDPANVFHDMVRTGLGVMRVDPAAMFDRPQKPDSWTSEQIDVTVAEDGTITSNGTGNFQLDGDPDDPSTWEVESRRPVVDRLKASYYEALKESLSRDLPVDHPQYCRPFGTRED